MSRPILRGWEVTIVDERFIELQPRGQNPRQRAISIDCSTGRVCCMYRAPHGESTGTVSYESRDLTIEQLLQLISSINELPPAEQRKDDAETPRTGDIFTGKTNSKKRSYDNEKQQ